MTASRSTLREKCTAVCWQRRLREDQAGLGVPAVPHLDVGRSIVRPIGRKLAAQIILRYEWLGTMPPHGARHYFFFGIFFGPYCAGVTCVTAAGGGANVNAWRMFGLAGPAELGYLCRGACVHWAPCGTNSRLVAWTCRLLAHASPCRVVVAYADTDAGEIGTIYQACGWAYIGKGSVTRQWIAPNGRIYDQKRPADLKRQKGGTRAGWVARLRAAGWREQKTNAKHRYCRVLDTADEALLARVASLRRPYPKRAGSSDSGTLATPGERGRCEADPGALEIACRGNAYG